MDADPRGQTERYLMDDFGSFRGMLVLAGDQADNATGQPQSGLWLGALDDLWAMGRPQGQGAVWRHDRVRAGQPSDPFLLLGFERKVLHLANEAEAGADVTLTVEVDLLGDGTWHLYERFRLEPGGYRHHEFPAGFASQCVRVSSDRDGQFTAHFVFT